MANKYQIVTQSAIHIQPTLHAHFRYTVGALHFDLGTQEEYMIKNVQTKKDENRRGVHP